MTSFYEIRKNDFSVKNNSFDVQFPNHIHNDIEILYMRSGTQILHIEDREILLSAGELAVIFPSIVHNYCRENGIEKNADEVLIICSSKFYRNFFSDLSDYYSENPIISIDMLPEDARFALNYINSFAPENVKIGLIMVIITRVLEHISLKHTKKIPISDFGFKLIEYINENFTEPLSLDSIAEYFSVSKSYVSRVFSEKIRINFRKYLGLVRAEYASTLIRSTDDSLTNIAENAGFESLRTFNRVFKDIYGITPHDFRNNINRYNN